MFKKIKDNIIKRMGYKIVIGYTNALLEETEKLFANEEVPFTYHNLRASLLSVKETYLAALEGEASE